MGKVWGVPYIDLSSVAPTEQAVGLLSPQFAKRFKSMPIELKDNKLIVAMANPLDVFVIDELRMNTGYEIEPMIAVEEDILNALADKYKLDVNLGDAYYAYRRREDGAADRLAHCLSVMDAAVPEWPFEYGLADIAYVPWLIRLRDLFGVELPDRIAARLDDLVERPAIAAELGVVAALAR